MFRRQEEIITYKYKKFLSSRPSPELEETDDEYQSSDDDDDGSVGSGGSDSQGSASGSGGGGHRNQPCTLPHPASPQSGSSSVKAVQPEIAGTTND